MAHDVADLIEAGLALDADERAVLVNALLNSLHEAGDGDQDEIDAAWSAEIGGRVDDVLNGKVHLVDADEHYARLRAELSTRRE